MTPAPAPTAPPLALPPPPGTPAGTTPARGGSGGGRTGGINPRTITEFDEITSIPFVFTRHPMYLEAHIHMNSIYSDAFLDVKDLFDATTTPQ